MNKQKKETGYIPLLTAIRGPLKENIYRGILAVSDNKKLIEQKGNGNVYCYLRSSAKPFQALPLLISGAHKHYRLTDAEIAITTSSHNGEPTHTKLVYEILRKAKIPEKALRCGTGYPLNKKLEMVLKVKKIKPLLLQNNCSGNHAGMLIACKFLGYPLDDYVNINHPIQQDILKIFAELTGLSTKDIAIGIDGCQAPTFGLPISKTAMLFAKLAKPDLTNHIGKALEKVRDAMMNNPYLIGGEKRVDTIFMKAKRGVVFKSGAAGLICTGIMKNGYGIVLKMESGMDDHFAVSPEMRVGSAIILETLKQLKIFNKKEQKYMHSFVSANRINNYKKIVGKLLPLFKI